MNISLSSTIDSRYIAVIYNTTIHTEQQLPWYNFGQTAFTNDTHTHGGETSIDIRRLTYASELSSVGVRRQNTQNTDLRWENPVTRYLNAFLRTSMGCISHRNIHTSIGIHFGHDAIDPIFVIRVPVNVHAECVWAILRNLYKSKQYRKYITYE